MHSKYRRTVFVEFPPQQRLYTQGVSKIVLDTDVKL